MKKQKLTKQEKQFIQANHDIIKSISCKFALDYYNDYH